MDSNQDLRTQSIVTDMLKELQDASQLDGTTFTLKEEPNDTTSPVSDIVDDDILEVAEFDYEGFQVVRREFFAHINEPSITFNNYKVYVNAACLKKLPLVEFVQVLVNSEKKILAIRSCKESERDAFAWCSSSSGKRKPKQITCRLFFAKVFTLMGWNPDYKYKLLGKAIHANDEYLIAFDLNSKEEYQRIFKEGEKPKMLRKPVFHEEGADQFGLPFKEHQKSMQINIFDGYAVYAIKENKITESSVESDSGTETEEKHGVLLASGGSVE